MVVVLAAVATAAVVVVVGGGRWAVGMVLMCFHRQCIQLSSMAKRASALASSSDANSGRPGMQNCDVEGEGDPEVVGGCVCVVDGCFSIAAGLWMTSAGRLFIALAADGLFRVCGEDGPDELAPAA